MYDEVYNNQYGFEVPDEHIPTDEELTHLSKGDTEIIPMIMEGVTKFIINEMNWLMKCNEHLLPYKEDVFSEAFLAVAEACKSFKGKPPLTPPRFLAIIKQSAINAVMTWVFKTQLPFSVPSSTLHLHEEEFQEITSRPIKEADRKTGDEAVFSEVWFDDFISSLSKEDQAIISLKLAGKSNREIGEELYLHHQFVQSKLKELLEIYGGRDD